MRAITKYGWLGQPLFYEPGKEQEITFIEMFS